MPRADASMSISGLRNMLKSKTRKLSSLIARRDRLRKKLAKIESAIARLDRGGAGGRAKNSKSLVATLTDVLSRAPKGMSVGNIVAKVTKSGYQSTSPSFRSIVNQTLIKERGKFANVSRGVYALKK